MSICELSLIFTSSLSDSVHKHSIQLNETKSSIEHKPQQQKQALDLKSPLLFTHLNLQRISSSTVNNTKANRKDNGEEEHKQRKDVRQGSYMHVDLSDQQNSVGGRDRDAVSKQVVAVENDSDMARTQKTKENSAGKTKEPLKAEGWSSTSGSVWDKVTQSHMKDFAEGNIPHNTVLEDNHMLESATAYSGSSLFQDDNADDDDVDDDDNVGSRKWKEPPIDYYKCGKCICHNSENGVTVHIDCRNFNLNHIPENLPENTTDINLSHNHVYLAFKKLSSYTSLRVLNVSSNSIIEVPSCTHNDSLSLHTLDLSDNGIQTIKGNTFLCLPQLEILYLRENYIQVVTNMMLAGLPRLQHFDISSNYLGAIEVNAFVQCPGLKILNLSINKNMTYGIRRLNSTIFKPLKQLEILDIHGFGPSNLFYPTAVLLELTSLRELSIDGVQIGRFETNLTALRNMSKLSIGLDGHCAIKNLSEDYFVGFPNLKSVHLAQCAPHNISHLVFAANKVLENLKYTGTSYIFEDLFDSLSGLQNSSLKSLSINSVAKFAKRTACRQLGKDQAKYIKNMHNLEELNLENNLVSYIQKDFLSNLPMSLKKLSFRMNIFYYLRSVLRTGGTGKLVNLVELKEDMQSTVIYLKSQDNHLFDDSLETDEDVAECREVRFSQPALPSLSAICSNSASKNSSHPETVGYFFPPNLQIYSATQSFNFGHILFSKSIQTNKLRYFDISNTYITDWGTKVLPKQIEVADVSENFCDSLKLSFFRPNNSLKELHAAGNFLGETFASDVRGEILSRLRLLRYLDISRNHIQELPWPFLTGLTSVEVINLSGNRIHSFNVSLSNLSNLTFLNLSSNSISWINRQSLDDLDRINARHQVSLDLTFNPLSCSCAGLPLVQWLASTKVRILSKDFLKCVNDNNEGEDMGDLQERFHSLQRNCASKIVMILIISFSFVFVFVIALAVWMFRNRWRLHYLRNITIARFFGYKVKNDQEEKQYAYDAYILYSKQDKGFVLRDCLRELETKRNHKLCVEDRDFLLGTFMTCTVTSAVCSSRLTIPLISPDFWASEWCEYGVQMAKMESIHSHRDVLHLLIYRPIPVATMPENLLKLLKENTSCEYPPDGCDDNVKTAFWDALSKTIDHTQRREIADGNQLLAPLL